MAAPARGGSAAGRTWLGALGALAVAASLAWVAGPAGLAIAAALAAAWWWLPGPYAVAAGHVAALPVLPTGLDPVLVVALEAGFLGILGAPVARGPHRPSTLAVLALAGLGLGAVAWHGWYAWGPRWLAGAAVVGAVAAGGYGLHRYSVVSLAQRGVARRP